jgi:hypothetical protein
MFLAPVRVLVNFAHRGHCSEIRRRRLESRSVSLSAKIRNKSVSTDNHCGHSLLSEHEEVFSTCLVYALYYTVKVVYGWLI